MRIIGWVRVGDRAAVVEDHLVFRCQVMRRVIRFFLGAAVGVFLSLVPGLVERATGIYLCRESCPKWFLLGSLFVYLAIPILWGLLLAFAGSGPGKRRVERLVGLFGASALLMLVIAWSAHLLHLR